jgi:hypothetical protein
MAETMTSVDFMTGILAGLALRGVSVLDMRDPRFDQAMGRVYDEMLDLPEVAALDIDFQVIPDAMHGDSAVVQDAITAAIESRLARRVNPTFRRLQIVIDREWADVLTKDDLPGGQTLYLRLVDRFMEHYRAQSLVQ